MRNQSKRKLRAAAVSCMIFANRKGAMDDGVKSCDHHIHQYCIKCFDGKIIAIALAGKKKKGQYAHQDKCTAIVLCGEFLSTHFSLRHLLFPGIISHDKDHLGHLV